MTISIIIIIILILVAMITAIIIIVGIECQNSDQFRFDMNLQCVFVERSSLSYVTHRRYTGSQEERNIAVG